MPKALATRPDASSPTGARDGPRSSEHFPKLPSRHRHRLPARLGGFMTSLLSAFDQTVRRLISAAVAIAAALILLVAVLISADVASQAIFQAPIPVVSELA